MFDVLITWSGSSDASFTKCLLHAKLLYLMNFKHSKVVMGGRRVTVITRLSLHCQSRHDEST